ncbi:hypothetical protein G6O69_20765 [Pseudenhygromyxa sp. WMMC2535]|uniref:monooxygenase n=1 Tax=Pseudenhygromyxa sp. WMMC2535 TaxID=2712867 RepID=UPI0015578C99|nr:hypothetical protein [Pseudenhygromyxa sp. WMMC2535]NVB40287.1 hypothetical protein [Pseudenhygromyxa sp. WMMC2535]
MTSKPRSLLTLALSCAPLLAPSLACSGDDTGGNDDEAEATAESDESEAGSEGTETGEDLRPTWHQDIAPIVYNNCVGCHNEGGIAPFALEDHSQAAAWSELIDEVVASGEMPPWGALETDECQPEYGWRNDARLSDADKQLIADWVAAGSPEGDPANAAALPEPPNLDLDSPTATFQNPTAFNVGGSEDSFICYSLDPGLEQDVWVTGVQMLPDNEQVVHHVLIYADEAANSAQVADADGSYPCFGTAGVSGAKLIGTWVPGAFPTEMPDDVGLPLPAGSRIILAYHYHPTGMGNEIDQSSVAVRWTEEPPAYEGLIDLVGNFTSGPNLLAGPNDPGSPSFVIPADIADHTETMRFSVPDAVPGIDLFTLGTHMHYVGTDMRVSLERDGEEKCLIQTPRWDFNWQRVYNIDANIGQFPKVQGGDEITLRCTYDNTLDNPFLVDALAEQGYDAPVDVYMGESSLDEMCLLIFGLAYPI